MNIARIARDRDLAVIIEDDAEVRQQIEIALVDLGMRVESFQSAKDALASIDQNSPVVIFLDVALLNSDAIDVLHGLGERHYGGVVQLMSGGRPSLLEAVQRIGVRQGVKLATPLNKPFAPPAIAKLIESLRSSDAPSLADCEIPPATIAVSRH